MDLDFRKKFIIGGFVAVVLIVLIYIYYDYIGNNEESSVNIETNIEDTNSNNIINNKNENIEENIIVIHMTGAVNIPRNCKSKRRSKII